MPEQTEYAVRWQGALGERISIYNTREGAEGAIKHGHYMETGVLVSRSLPDWEAVND
jgi:hypothetical protein